MKDDNVAFFAGWLTAVVGALIGFILSIFFPISGFGADYSKAKVEFTAVGFPSAMTIVGKAEGIQAKIDGENGEASFELSKLDTGISLRNTHMKRDLNVTEFPKATLKWNKFMGDLTLHGVTKPVVLIKEGKKYSFEVKPSEFGLPKSAYAGIGVEDKVSVTVELQ